jgi:acyl-coenzyme A thioesterase PaaI-like protein
VTLTDRLNSGLETQSGMSAGEDREFTREIMRWLADVPVEGSLGVVVDEITSSSLRMSAPVPYRDGLPDPHAVDALICVLTDSAAGLAAAVGRPQGQGGATIELRVDYGPLPGPGVRRLAVEGTQLHSLAGAELCTAVLTDDAGHVLARATGHFAAVASGTGGLPAPPPPGHPDAVLAALRLGPALDPLSRGLELPGLLANPRGVIHGGALLTLVQSAQRAALTAANPQGDPPRLLSTQTEFLRPVPCGDGSGADLTTRFGRRGRRFSTLHSEVVLPDGRLAATTTGLWATPD